MKKFLLPMLLALAILIPSAQVQAAYVLVPNFYNMASNRIEEHIRFNGADQEKHNGVSYTSWHYTCVDGNTYEYVNRYIRKIDSKHDFRQVGHKGNNWYFAYTGSQAKFVTAFNGGFHVHVGVSGDDVDVNLVAGLYPE